MHAALINGLAAIAIYHLAIMLGLIRPYAVVMGLMSAVFLYVPMGTPAFEQHSFAFIIFSAWTCSVSFQSPDATHQRRWDFTTIFLCFLAYLSKPSPGIISPVLIVLMSLLRFEHIRTRLKNFLIGFTTIAAIVMIYAFFIDMDWAAGFYYQFDLPRQIGLERISTVQNDLGRALAYGVQQLPANLHIKYFINVLCLSALICLSCFAYLRRKILQSVLLIFLGYLILFFSWFFIITTNNQEQNGIGLLALSTVFIAAGSFGENQKNMSTWTRCTVHGCLIILCAAILHSTWVFHESVNKPRIVHDLRVQENEPFPSTNNIPGLAFLKWKTPYPVTPIDLQNLLSFLSEEAGSFLQIGDWAILYALSGHPSPSDILWFHYGFSLPPRHSTEFQEFETRLLANLKKYNVDKIVTSKSWMKFSIDHLPRVKALLLDDQPERQFGNFRVYRLQSESQKQEK